LKNSEGLGAFKPNRKELNKPTTHFQTRSPIHHQQQEFTIGAFKPNRKELNKPTTHFQTRSPIHHQQQEFTKKLSLRKRKSTKHCFTEPVE